MFVVVYGPGNNGKTTLIKKCESSFKPKEITTIPYDWLCCSGNVDINEIFDYVQNKRLVRIMEPDDTFWNDLDLNKVKHLTSCETIYSRKNNEPGKSLTFTGNIIIESVTDPRKNEHLLSNSAFMNRMTVVDLSHVQY